MERIQKIREIVDGLIAGIEQEAVRRTAYVHLYGVSQYGTMLALKRNLSWELVAVAGMLHDITTYCNDTAIDHAAESAQMAQALLHKTERFSDAEVAVIIQAINRHSEKQVIHTAYDEVLKDADVIQHFFYNPSPKSTLEDERLQKVLKEISFI